MAENEQDKYRRYRSLRAIERGVDASVLLPQGTTCSLRDGNKESTKASILFSGINNQKAENVE
ncbi:hypothetical protein CCMA1212_001453 [Trichoderma ghanense]|uniref:Uncharacterized protein n=1 Tax=Trichoderma ghanense TaxID=65468 RepID=A0ABY2HGT6_9HYPO